MGYNVKYGRYKVLQGEGEIQLSGCPFTSLFSLKNKESLKKQEKHPTVPIKIGSTPTRAPIFSEIEKGKNALQLMFVNLEEQDITTLMSLKPIMEKNVEKIVDAFYARISEIPNLTMIIQEHSTIHRLKQTLEKYILDMVSGDVGEKYVVRRKVIGSVHNRIGLFPEWYIGAFTIIQHEVLQMLTRECDSWQEAQDYYYSFQKLCSFDMQIAIQTYIKSYTSSMMKLNEIEELQYRLNDSSSILASSAKQTMASLAERDTRVQSMLEDIDEINTGSKAMIHHVEAGKGNVSKALKKVDDVVDLIEKVKNLTEELNEDSLHIGQVVQTIRTLSNQTNILSLNAGIEAARAGQHGKGFSIVAQEVRNLARKTELSLDSIQQQVASVQKTVMKFDESFQSIVDEARFFRHVNKEIIDILDDSVRSVKESDGKISHLGGEIGEFRSTFEELTSASSQISEMAEQLSSLNIELSQKFKG